MQLPPAIIEIIDKVVPLMRRIDNVSPIPYTSCIILFILFVGLSTFLMNMYTRLKPKKSLHTAKISGSGARRLKKEASAHERAGRLTQAAEAYKALGKPNKALDLFRKAGALKQAGELMMQMGRKEEAIQMWVSEGSFALAANQLAKDKAYDRAAGCYERANNPSQAAEMFEKAGNYARAGEQYSKAGFYAKAASCLEKAGSRLPAARAYEKYFLEQAPQLKANITADKERAIRKLAFKAGDLYRKCDKLHEAAEIFIKGGLNADAARTLEELGELQRAAQLYREAGRHADAARLYEASGGDSREGAASRAEDFRSKGQFAEAAKAFAEAEDYNMAADMYARAEMPREAAEMLLKAGSYYDAGNLFMQAGDKRKAAWAFEQTREFDTAIKLYQEVGDTDSVIRCMIAADRAFDAAKILWQQKKSGEAYKILETIGPDSPDYPQAVTIMARMQASSNRIDVALQMVQKAIKALPPGSELLELYYTLGTLFEQRGDYQLAIDTYSKVLYENYAFKDVAARQQSLKDRLMHTAPAPPGAMPAAGGDDAERTLLYEDGGAPQGAAVNRRYKIIGELGRGGMGVVYKAVDSVLDREVAYKVLPPDMKNHPEVVKKFNEEAKVLAQLIHPNIVTVFDAGGMGGEYYFVMEYIDGMNLKDSLRDHLSQNRQFSIADAINIFKQLAQALSYAHSKDIVHRDIKTSNVMLQSDGNVKLMDFGLAKILEGASSDRTAVSGTPYYMSPEQTLGKGVDYRTDIYSLGVMMFELVTGRVPFQSGDLGYHHLHTEPDPPGSIRADVPPELEAVILKAMEKDKGKRYQSAADILEDLNKIRLN